MLQGTGATHINGESVSFIVPVGGSYSITFSTLAKYAWKEMR